MPYANVLKQVETQRDEIGEAPDLWTASELPRAGKFAGTRGCRPYTISRARRDEMLQMVQRLFLADNLEPLQKVMFCGVDGNRSSEVCAAAATVLSGQIAGSVCMVDGGLEAAELSKLFGVKRGLVQPRSGKSCLAQCVPVAGNLYLAGTGVLAGCDGGMAPANELRQRVTLLASTFDYLLFDAPGVNTTTDAALLGQVVGSAVLVLEEKTTRRAAAAKAKLRLEAGTVTLLGTVLTQK